MDVRGMVWREGSSAIILIAFAISAHYSLRLPFSFASVVMASAAWSLVLEESQTGMQGADDCSGAD